MTDWRSEQILRRGSLIAIQPGQRVRLIVKRDSHSRRAVGSFAEQGRVRVVVSSERIHLGPVKVGRQTADAGHKQ